MYLFLAEMSSGAKHMVTPADNYGTAAEVGKEGTSHCSYVLQGPDAGCATNAPEAVMLERHLVCLQDQQVRVVLLPGVNKVAVVKLQNSGVPPLVPSLGSLCAILSIARPAGEARPSACAPVA